MSKNILLYLLTSGFILPFTFKVNATSANNIKLYQINNEVTNIEKNDIDIKIEEKEEVEEEIYDNDPSLPISIVFAASSNMIWSKNEDAMKLNFLESCKALSEINLFYNKRVFNYTHLCFGIGLVKDEFSFKSLDNIDYNNNITDRKFTFKKSKDIIKPSAPISTDKDSDGPIINSYLRTSLFEIMPEIRINTNKNNLKKGFFISIGPRIGIAYNTSRYIKYKEQSIADKKKYEVKTSILSGQLGLKKIRYGLSLKVGYGRFSLSYITYLSNILNNSLWGKKDIEAKNSKININVELF